MKKFTVLFLILLLTIGLFGCGKGTSGEASEKGKGKVKLTVAFSMADQSSKNAFLEIIKDFEKENPNIKVDAQELGSYENTMKMKMASNELPDLFDTHGWSIKRYGNYLADLSGEQWVANLSDSIKPVITDEKGKVYAFPLNEAKDGVLYNVEVLEKYKIEPPKTFDELMDASEKIVKESNGEVTPFFFSGLDSWTIGQYFDYFATPLLISPKENHADELLNNKFNWNNWTYLPEKFKEMYKKGYINKEMLTAKYVDEARLFAENKLAFALHGPASLADVKKINSNAKLGVFPIPAIQEGDKPTFAGGERYTLGLWKDSKHPKEAKKLLAFFSKEENVKKMADVTFSPAPFKSVEGGAELTTYYEKYKDIRVFSYFDRAYLPNGMWDVMLTNGEELISGNITPEQYSENMEKEVKRLNSQQKK
ncbi:ABC transporter substrate-binding protein [Bacillus pseudomycoides]|uniref:ABC transporter substrate-binding protein n=1 Tax=Bacillus pseudomycoides TaxID=64104 RepID=UPI001FB1F596|nr:ABC transporter substrate-binding protein [Bacillus pseudomycoides]